MEGEPGKAGAQRDHRIKPAPPRSSSTKPAWAPRTVVFNGQRFEFSSSINRAAAMAGRVCACAKVLSKPRQPTIAVSCCPGCAERWPLARMHGISHDAATFLPDRGCYPISGRLSDHDGSTPHDLGPGRGELRPATRHAGNAQLPMTDQRAY